MEIHRCRFVPYPPSTINIVAFSHSQLTRGTPQATRQTLRLAIGRANGDIEIWNPFNGAWLQESILRGGKDRSVDGLVWIQDPDDEDFAGTAIFGRLRLFSIGYTTTVTEWDLEKGKPLRESSGNYGEIWCLAAQPSLPRPSKEPHKMSSSTEWRGQNLVTGCTDGAVVLHSTADQDLKLQRLLVRPSAKKAKIISVHFQNRNIVVAGCTDSAIRIYDIRNSTLIRSISLGGGLAGGPKEIIVWAVKCLPNENIVSGDSTGEVRIWDGRTYTLVQRIKSHRQDVLSLAMSFDGSTILSGGMDRRTVVYKQIGVGRTRWAEVTHKRYHSHDVKTMATFEGNGVSVVVSGGPDSSPMVIPLRAFDQENQRMLPSLPQRPALLSVPRKRLVMSWWDREVHIWRINNTSTVPDEIIESDNEVELIPHNRKLVARIAIKGEANINSASVNMTGDLLAVSTLKNVKIFRLRSRMGQKGDSLKISKLELPQKISSEGARYVQFSPDGHWLCLVGMDSRVVIVRIGGSEYDPTNAKNLILSIFKLERIDRKIEKRILLGGLGAYDRIINQVAFSADSCILAVSDLAGYIDTWVLEGQEDLSQPMQDAAAASYASSSMSSDDSDGDDDEKPVFLLGQRWRRNPSASLIPRLPAPAVVLSFRLASVPLQKAQNINGAALHPTRQTPHPISHDLPNGEARLLVVTAKTEVFEFEVLRGSLSTWSRANPTAKFPSEFKAVMDQAMDCLWDITESRERLWIYGSRWMWMFDLSRDFPDPQTLENDQDSGAKLNHIVHPNLKRKRDRSGAGGQIPDESLGTGMSRRVQQVLHEDKTEVSEVVLDYGYDIGSAEEDEESEVIPKAAKTSPLDRLRKAADAAMGSSQDKGTDKNGDDQEVGQPRHWWRTYKYRPIMGIVPLSREDFKPNTASGLEVALVERPEWDADLPPRYYGDHERDSSGL